MAVAFEIVALLLAMPTLTMIIGGLVVHFTSLNAKVVASAQHFASGILVGAVAWELTPALNATSHTEKGSVLFGFVFGAFALMFIGRYDFKHWQSCNTVKEDEETEALLSKIEAVSRCTTPARAQKPTVNTSTPPDKLSPAKSSSPSNGGSSSSSSSGRGEGEPKSPLPEEGTLSTDLMEGSSRASNPGSEVGEITINISSSSSTSGSSSTKSPTSLVHPLHSLPPSTESFQSSPLASSSMTTPLNKNRSVQINYSSTNDTITTTATTSPTTTSPTTSGSPGGGGSSPGGGATVTTPFLTPRKPTNPRHYKALTPHLEEFGPHGEGALSPRTVRFNMAGGKSPSRRRALQLLIEVGEKGGVLSLDDEEIFGDSTHKMEGKLPVGLVIAIAIDCAIDGLLIGITFQARGMAGLITAIALAIEQLLLGISLGTSLTRSGLEKWKTISLIVFLPFTVIGAGLLGNTVLAGLSGEVFLGIISFGVAGLLYLVTEELLIEAHEKIETDLWFISILFFAGFAFVIALDTYAAH